MVAYPHTVEKFVDKVWSVFNKRDKRRESEGMGEGKCGRSGKVIHGKAILYSHKERPN
jgi:hypothetical protein